MLAAAYSNLLAGCLEDSRGIAALSGVRQAVDMILSLYIRGVACFYYRDVSAGTVCYYTAMNIH